MIAEVEERAAWAKRSWPDHRGLGQRLAVALVALLIALAPALARAQSPARRLDAPPTLSDCLHHINHPCLTPGQIRAAYGVDTLLKRGITGRGRTIAIVVSFGSPTLRDDLHTFDQAFGLPDPTMQILAPLGTHIPTDSGWVGETTLDVEWAHAIAPGARIVLLESPVDETEGIQGLPEFLALEQYALQRHLVDVFSQSWTATEDTLFDKQGRAIVDRFHRFYAQAVARGVTIVNASGDEGAGGPDLTISHLFPYPVVGYPASDPLVLAVGGTQLTVSPNGNVTAETAWSGSGGGVSKLFTEPAYQQALPLATQRLLKGHRGLPDISYNAAVASPVLIYARGRWTVAAGTSAAAPQWAGLMALADQAAGHDLGAIQPALYRLAMSPRYSADLRDITAGSIVGPTDNGDHLGGSAYRAGPGWDAATGWGSPRVAALIPDLAKASS